MFRQVFRASLARFTLGLATDDEIVDGAHSALDSGVCSESLGEIITAKGRNEFEMNALFATALNEPEMLVLQL